MDRKLIKKSTVRVIETGNIQEVYKYHEPYFYNLPPALKSQGNSTVKIAEKRNDHLARARSNLYRLIFGNIGKSPPVFCTLTYAKNEVNREIAQKDLTRFLHELVRKRWGNISTNGIEPLRYIYVPERQKRGAWHFHILLMNIRYVPDIKIKMQRLWRHGFIQIKAVRKIKNIAAYVSKYISKDFSQNFQSRAYNVSRNLKRPIEIRNEIHAMQAIENFGENATLETVAERTYQGRFGEVYYTLKTKK